MAAPKTYLVTDIWQDIYRNMPVYTLLALVVVSAFSVIYFTHINRQATSRLEELLTERDDLDVEWRNLLLEQNSLTEHSMVESKARKLLNMKKPTGKSEIIIKIQE